MKTRGKPKICFTCVYFNINYSQPFFFFFKTLTVEGFLQLYNCPDLGLSEKDIREICLKNTVGYTCGYMY